MKDNRQPAAINAEAVDRIARSRRVNAGRATTFALIWAAWFELTTARVTSYQSDYGHDAVIINFAVDRAKETGQPVVLVCGAKSNGCGTMMHEPTDEWPIDNVISLVSTYCQTVYLLTLTADGQCATWTLDELQ